MAIQIEQEDSELCSCEQECCVFCNEPVDYLNIPYGPLMEEWRDVVDYEDYYKVSNYGRLISKERLATGFYTYKTGLQKYKSIPIQEQELLLRLNTKGYWHVGLSKNANTKNTSLHRIMCIAFMPNTLNKPHINHKNSVRDDKFISAFEWCTPKENSHHAKTNTMVYNDRNIKIAESKKKLDLKIVEKIRELLKTKVTQRKIASMFNISNQTVSLINLGESTYDTGGTRKRTN